MPGELGRQKRSTITFAKHEYHPWRGMDPNALSDKNLWHEYAMMIAKQRNVSRCFVCSVMPRVSTQPILFGHGMPEHLSRLYASIAGVGCIRKASTDSSSFPFDRLTSLSRTSAQPLGWYQVNASEIHPVCYQRKHGTIHVGNTTRCNHTCTSSQDSPDPVPVTGGWWACGNKVYATIPKNWTGSCVPVFLTDHTVIISAANMQAHHIHRRKRGILDVKPHDSIWGTDVPEEHKHWSTGDKVLLSLFPWIGTAKNTLRLETVDYRLKLLTNLTIDVNAGQNVQIEALRMMVLQNRFVLDMVTAAQGGTCVMLNTTCCTYIPSGNDTGVHDAMNGLRKLQRAMNEDGRVLSWDLWSWLISGPWWHLLLRIISPVIVVFILFCVFTSCILPCLRSILVQVTTQALMSYHLLTMADDV